MLHHSMSPVWEFLTWSLNCCYIGRYPGQDVNGRAWAGDPRYPPGSDMGLRCRLWELRGDWKWHQVFSLRSTWMSDACCHICKATKSKPAELSYVDFTRRPAWLETRRTHEQFLMEQLPIERACNPLCYAFGFDYRCIRICSMHCVNLGIALHANGGAMHELLEHNVFEGQSVTEKFRDAFNRFKAWCSENGISCSQSCFKPYMLVTSKGEEYCYFQTKDTGLHIRMTLDFFGMLQTHSNQDLASTMTEYRGPQRTGCDELAGIDLFTGSPKAKHNSAPADCCYNVPLARLVWKDGAMWTVPILPRIFTSRVLFAAIYTSI